ncbi:unnamed protein product, partial [Discosporangium mesarthrocarpum]
MGGGTNALVTDLYTLANGELVASGLFSSAGGVATPWGLARWDGSVWGTMPAGGPNNYVRDLTVLPDGDLVVVGDFTVPGMRVARFDGSSWSAFGSGLDGNAECVALGDDGLLIGGSFDVASLMPSRGFARMEATCPAEVAALGGGCASSGGANELEVQIA